MYEGSVAKTIRMLCMRKHRDEKEGGIVCPKGHKRAWLKVVCTEVMMTRSQIFRVPDIASRKMAAHAIDDTLASL